MSSLVVKILTVLLSTISNSQLFLLKKNVSSFCRCKSYSHLFSKNISIYAIFNDQSLQRETTFADRKLPCLCLKPFKIEDCVISNGRNGSLREYSSELPQLLDIMWVLEYSFASPLWGSSDRYSQIVCFCSEMTVIIHIALFCSYIRGIVKEEYVVIIMG